MPRLSTRGPSKESCGRLAVDTTIIHVVGQSKESCNKIDWSSVKRSLKTNKKKAGKKR